ncbi:MAG: putative transporter [Bacteroidales bacterium]|jgi:putative transport protein|nr:putative transporter [Paludibacteraceae bacterium]MCR5247736.1 putative transporter [Paludibacteraceae bacterium]MDD5996691.1 putative transporter [Bacteroidales bacterium]MDO4525027.1 putative transporter [Bacteroidales bacterium]
MEWFFKLLSSGSVAYSLLLLSFTIVAGLAIGNFKVKGFTLGVTWILFVGIFVGNFYQIDSHILHFVKELGLILFVYSIGMQVGPSFFSSFRSGGINLNLMAVGLVFLNVMAAYLIYCITGEDLKNMVGILSGAVTNTPGLGAAQQAYSDATGNASDFLAAGYAIAYPMGVVGIIIILAVVNFLWGKETHAQTEEQDKSSVEIYTVQITNKAIDGMTLGKLKQTIGKNFVVTRLHKAAVDEVKVPNDDTVLSFNDKMYVISNQNDSEAVKVCVGTRLEMDMALWDKLDGGQLVSKRLVVTKSEMNGKTFAQLKIQEIFGVNISRVIRTGIDLVPSPTLQLQVGDSVIAVGDETSVNKLGLFVGNSNTQLDHPHLIQVFLGITLGVLLGSIPFDIPGIPQPVKLGLAGGPLIVSILIAKFGIKFNLVTYTRFSAKKMLQEIGIMLFLAAVGLGAGKSFVSTFQEVGLSWFVYGIVITMVPMIIILLIGRFVLKLNAAQLMGFASGSTTNPPALAFSNTADATGKASLSYATVYPLTMFLRVMSAQFLVLMAL